jgi:hypothetical protein
MARRVLFFVLLGTCLVLLARVGEQHDLRLDLTAERIHSPSPSARDALERLSGQLEMTVFLSDYPVQRAQLERLLAPYLAHPAAPRLAFVDPVSEPERAREAGVSAQGELHLEAGGRREVVQRPTAAAVDAALNRLALRGERWIVGFRGHGEAEVDEAPGGLVRLVEQVERLGYRYVALDPRHLEALPDNAAALLLAGPQREYGPQVLALIEGFIDRGGAVLWLVDPAATTALGGLFGVGLLPGVVVDAAAAAHGLEHPDNAVVDDYPAEVLPRPPRGHSVLYRARALRLRDDAGWQPVGRLRSSPRSWNETGELRGAIARDPQAGEQAGPLTLGVALQRTQDGREERAVIVGSRDLVSNAQVGRADNLALAVGLLHWLTDNPQLSSPPPARDLDLRWSPQVAGLLAIGLMGVLPAAYLAAGLWLRGRRRRA